MELFDPGLHLSRLDAQFGKSAEAALPLARAAQANPGLTLIPRPEDCYALWDSYAMLDNIRAHSARVADLARAMALAARARGMDVSPDAVCAAGLLHDLGKTYTIAHGGSHAQLGAAWVMRETRNAPVARAVMFHVHWPFAEGADDDSLFLVLSIVYADKRVKHDAYVSIDERFEDLVERYGVNDFTRSRIELSRQQGKRIEAELSRRLEVRLHEHTADNGRLVKRT
jgi:putative nucleotidyltransferase with HDIG domain